VAEQFDWKGLKIKKSVGNRKIIMSHEVRHRIGKGRISHAVFIKSDIITRRFSTANTKD
jgi:hypothetical protein